MADRVALGGDPPDNGELLEVQELLQAGQRLLLGGRRSADWMRTHHATDAAEEAADQLQRMTRQRGTQRDPEGELATLQNLLAAAADGIYVLVGTYPHAGDAEGVPHAADVIAMAEGDQNRRATCGGQPQALHVYRAKRKLRQLQPFLVGDLQREVRVALLHLAQWTTEHWGEEVELVQDNDDSNVDEGGEATAARASKPTTTAAEQWGSEGAEPRRRRSLDSPSSLDNDD